MKIRSFFILPMLLLGAVLFSACQARAQAADSATASSLPLADMTPAVVDPSPTTQPTQASEPTAAKTPTQVPERARADAAAQAARTYFTALSDGKTAEAADQLSRFSLMVFQMTRGDAASLLQTQKIEGMHWTNLQIQETETFDAQTMLVHVTYSVSEKEPASKTATPAAAAADSKTEVVITKDELWPMRLESGAWRYNWNNIIDFRTLDARAQTMNGITIMPVQINRYSDRVQLSMLVQNRTNEAVVFGQVNEILGTFYFGEQAVVAEKAQWILNPLRSVPAAILEAKGLFADYPDTIEIRKWKSYNVKPWYVFQLQ